MAGKFISPDGDLETIFISDYATIDQYAKTGSLWLWGDNTYGQLGDNTTTSKSSPVQTISGGTNWKQVSSNAETASAIKTDGTLWLWGKNNYGQLGDNTRVNKSSPVQTISGGTNWKQVSMGSQGTVGAIKTDGTLWCWGVNFSPYATVGDNTTSSRSSPVQTVAGGNNWKQIVMDSTAIALKTDGTIWTWGNNVRGSLGNLTSGLPVSSPVQSGFNSNTWVRIASGGVGSMGAIKNDGTLWCWGNNNQGAVGVSPAGTDVLSPVQTVAGGNNWKEISIVDSAATAIKTDGTLWSWGYNGNGRLGDNTTTSKSSPVQTISGGTNWRKLAAYGGIKSDGSLWLWGGVPGDNTTTTKSSPVQTIAAGTNWKQASKQCAIYFYGAGNLYPSS